MEQRDQREQVVDLTESDDIVQTGPAEVGSRRRRKRAMSRAEVQGGNPLQPGPANVENDIEIVSVQQSRRTSPKRKRRQPAPPSSDDGLDVVDEKHITPQERLRQIQERHARGETVQSNAPVETRSYPLFGLDNRPGVSAPRSLHPYLMPPPNSYGFMNGDDIPANVFLDAIGRSYDQQIINETLQASLDDISPKRFDPKTLMLPAVPSTEARPGFTRTPNVEGDLVCIQCNHVLGTPGEGLSTTAKQQGQQVFVRGCGHVYCGSCTFAMKYRVYKSRACPVDECKTLSAKKRGHFREVFL